MRSLERVEVGLGSGYLVSERGDLEVFGGESGSVRGLKVGEGDLEGGERGFERGDLKDETRVRTDERE